MGGRDAQRGFIFQSIIATIECLDRDDWNEVKVEPDTALDKVDIQLYRDGKTKSAIQVKSSINKFGQLKVKEWLDELEKDAPSTDEILLYLVGDSFTEECEKYIGKNSDKIKKISFSYLKDICMGKIHSYVKKACPGEDVRVKDLDQIAANLFTGIHGNSIAQGRLTRDAFEEAFCSVLSERLYDRLKRVFANERKGHPSIRMMDPDPNLFPKGLPEIKSDNRLAVVDQESPRVIKDMILDSWKRDDKWHILLVGEGGIGKTVAMLTLPEEEWFRQYRIPAIYVPLQRLEAHEGKLNSYLKDKTGADYDKIIGMANRDPEGQPHLLLLLDGFNEISYKYKVTVENYIREWVDRPGVQVITTSRLGFDLENRFIKYWLQTLPPNTVESFLLSTGIEKEHLPKKNNPIWKVINVPLMLTLYTQIDRVKERADSSSVSSLLDWKKADNAAHIIWNYLQTELYRCVDNAGTTHSRMQYATAILAVAPYVCCQMSCRMKFYISQKEFQDFIREALSFYDNRQNLLSQQFKNLRRKYDRYSKENLFQEDLDSDYSQILVESMALFQEQETREVSGDIEYTYSLAHQNFRDALAAFFISSCVLRSPDSSDRKLLLGYADYYVKNYMAEHLSQEELIEIWDQHRDRDPEDGDSTFILLDLIGRQRNYDFRELDFSGIDLTKTNLHTLLSKRLDICPLPSDSRRFVRTKTNIDCLSPNGPEGGVNSVAYSPDGRHVAISEDDGMVRIWDLESGEIRVLESHTGSANSVAYSPDGRHLASGTDDGTVWIWDLESEESRVLESHTGSVNSVAYSPDGRYVASGADDFTVQILNLEGRESRVLEGHEGIVKSVAYSLDGKYFASGTDDGMVWIWGLESGEIRVLGNDTGDVNSVAYSPDGRHLASSAGDRTVRIWDFRNGKSRVLKGHTGDVNSVAYSPDGRHLASGAGDRTVRIWDLESGESRVLKGHTGKVNSIAYSPDGRHLASGTDDGTVRIWDLESGKNRVLESRESNFYRIAYSPDGKHLASGAGDRTVRIWELESGNNRVLEGHAGRVYGAAYSPDGRYLASGADDRTVRIWDLKNGECNVLEGNAGLVRSVAYSPDGMRVAFSTDDKKVRIWDLKSGKIRVLEGHSGIVYCVTYSSDGRHLASGASDRKVRIWDLKNGESRVLKGHTGWVSSVAYSSDGRYLASSAYDGTVRILDLKNGKNRVLKSYGGVFTVFNSVAYSPDGRYLASGSDDMMVQIWDLESRKSRVLKGNAGNVNSVTFSPDGRDFAISATDNTVRIWDLKEWREKERFKIIPGINLSGANFELADIDKKKDKIALKMAGAKVK